MIRLIGLHLIALLGALASAAQDHTDSASFAREDQTGVKSNLFSYFSCNVKNSNSVELAWRSETLPGGGYFIVERSNDGTHYETVSVQEITDTNTAFSHQDNPPSSGSDFYRIKYIGKSGDSLYSKPLEVRVATDVDFKFYPNPADKFLIVRSGHPVGVEILDENGSVKLQKQVEAGLQIVNVSSLQKGAYILKVSDQQSDRVISEQFVKN
jgi:hypothetical protein